MRRCFPLIVEQVLLRIELQRGRGGRTLALSIGGFALAHSRVAPLRQVFDYGRARMPYEALSDLPIKRSVCLPLRCSGLTV